MSLNHGDDPTVAVCKYEASSSKSNQHCPACYNAVFYWEPFGPWHVSHLTRTTHLKAVADKVLATTFADGSGHPAGQRTLLSDEHCSGLA